MADRAPVVQLTMSLEEAQDALAWLDEAAAVTWPNEPWMASMRAALAGALPAREAPTD